MGDFEQITLLRLILENPGIHLHRSYRIIYWAFLVSYS